MNKKLSNLIMWLTTGLVLTITILTQVASASTAKTKYILAHAMPTDHIFGDVAQRFSKRLSELSNGNMVMEYHPGGSLGDWTTIFEQNIRGSIQISLNFPYGELDPKVDIANLGFVASDWDSARKVYGVGGVMTGIYNDIHQKLGLTLLGTVPTDFTGFVVRKGQKLPINVPNDAKGFKMRVPPQPLALARYRALGFSPIPMAFSEVHTALQTGAIDGRAFSPPSEVLMFQDTLDAYVFTREHFEQTFFLINTAWLQSLNKDQQAWVKSAANDSVQWAWENAESQSEVWLKKIRDTGVKVIELTADQQRAYKEIVVETEWAIMEEMMGKKIMDDIKKAAGL